MAAIKMPFIIILNWLIWTIALAIRKNRPLRRILLSIGWAICVILNGGILVWIVLDFMRRGTDAFAEPVIVTVIGIPVFMILISAFAYLLAWVCAKLFHRWLKWVYEDKDKKEKLEG